MVKWALATDRRSWGHTSRRNHCTASTLVGFWEKCEELRFVIGAGMGSAHASLHTRTHRAHTCPVPTNKKPARSLKLLRTTGPSATVGRST